MATAYFVKISLNYPANIFFCTLPVALRAAGPPQIVSLFANSSTSLLL
jgi:hypothetical protein